MLMKQLYFIWPLVTALPLPTTFSENSVLEPGNGPQINIMDGASLQNSPPANCDQIADEAATLTSPVLETSKLDHEAQLAEEAESKEVSAEANAESAALAKSLVGVNESESEKTKTELEQTKHLEEEEQARHTSAMDALESAEEADAKTFEKKKSNLEHSIHEEKKKLAHDSREVQNGVEMAQLVREAEAEQLLDKKAETESKLQEIAAEAKLEDAAHHGVHDQFVESQDAKRLVGAANSHKRQQELEECEEEHEKAKAVPPESVVGIAEGVPCEEAR